MFIRNYEPRDEEGWLRCRVLSFLNTAYYDNVLQHKEKYHNRSIEIVAEKGGEIVGLLDLELEQSERQVCTLRNGLGAMMWHIAVHPDYQREGVGKQLLQYAESQLKGQGYEYLEAWTRDDDWVNHWYENQGFQKANSYYQAFISGEQRHEFIGSKHSEVTVLSAFAHYMGHDESVINKFERVYECNGYVKTLK
ncbi:GNAT family N-acetyltransferase [Alkalibacillus haloalkaliphilus]|uniref:N-acetyltransferase n=1 Tax=Alkalibacillus haloalkaliphilus TaxID=94136 RepID=A0A511W4M2_9BACI|nr:GNAT family N-acetyltransferase [Alkalibacillus haloalkaliphilus]GEN46056.1 N-acetyltransferase [Alkalibacillus haloalkaliphilus]